MLDAGDGHQVYWETCGNPTGKPALVLHGGPGSGCSAGWRQYFDPRIYRIVLFDQRGCGRSMPHASSPEVDLSTNTTAHLLADIELLRRQLNIERWLVLGGSWGSTLALAYTQQHPTHLTEMVLLSVGTTTALEVDWITRGLRAFFPEQWTRFRDGVPEAERKGNLVEAYNRLLMNPDPAIHEKAARDWCDWEMAIVAVHPNHKPHSRYEQPRFRLCFARLVTHYWRHNGWLQNDVLLQQVDRLAGIPAVLILCTPLIASWQLAKRWPGSECHGVSSSADVGFTKREVGSNCCAECFRPELNFLSQGLICCDPSRGGEFLATDAIGFAGSGFAVPHRHSRAERARRVVRDAERNARNSQTGFFL
jgi:proline iminopeptidase